MEFRRGRVTLATAVREAARPVALDLERAGPPEQVRAHLRHHVVDLRAYMEDDLRFLGAFR